MAFAFAGNAVMAYLLKVKIKNISLKHEDGLNGFFEWEDLFNGAFYPMRVMFEDMVRLEKTAQIALAGPIAEKLAKN